MFIATYFPIRKKIINNEYLVLRQFYTNHVLIFPECAF